MYINISSYVIKRNIHIYIPVYGSHNYLRLYIYMIYTLFSTSYITRILLQLHEKNNL